MQWNISAPPRHMSPLIFQSRIKPLVSVYAVNIGQTLSLGICPPSSQHLESRSLRGGWSNIDFYYLLLREKLSRLKGTHLSATLKMYECQKKVRRNKIIHSQVASWPFSLKTLQLQFFRSELFISFCPLQTKDSCMMSISRSERCGRP